MKISAIEVSRDKNGMWSHPDFPSWDENVDVSVLNKWFDDNNGGYQIVSLEDHWDDAMVESWFDNDLGDCSNWEPMCKVSGSFLLSIHDTEDGPVAVFFIPKTSFI